ncbi:hypothetical protein Lmor_1116 [Legionella moravica]|uniref:Mitochondrial carrier protein n=1 Tax=Legionella moravica TaxID=39962 RepID=A0A378K0L6_9GAMM|nr:hypothetical protein [Legionella moravica]KTD35669.1 hypothetical protein Lmor_1116 [Legionella moravica]STX62799.1 Mitochondrial carrier protein [Legionella moravica]
MGPETHVNPDDQYINTLIAASTSGLLGAGASFFFKGLKIRIQSGQALPSMSQLGAYYWAKETFRGTLSYAGCLVSTSIVQQMMARYLEKQNLSQTTLGKWSETLFSGALGGVTYNIAENIILEQQRKRMNALDATRSLLQQSPTRIIRGLPFVMAREAVFGFCYLKGVKQAGDYAREQWGSKYEMPAQILAGMGGALISHPFDTSSTTMQAYGYNKPSQAIRHLLSEASPFKALYRGGLARLGLFTSSALVMNSVRERVMEHLETPSV